MDQMQGEIYYPFLSEHDSQEKVLWRSETHDINLSNLNVSQGKKKRFIKKKKISE